MYRKEKLHTWCPSTKDTTAHTQRPGLPAPAGGSAWPKTSSSALFSKPNNYFNQQLTMNYLKESYVKTCKNLHVYRMDCRKRLSRTRDSRIGGSIDSSFKQTNRKDADLTLRNLIGWHTSEPRVLDYCVDLNSCAYTLSIWVTNLTTLLGMASKLNQSWV